MERKGTESSGCLGVDVVTPTCPGSRRTNPHRGRLRQFFFCAQSSSWYGGGGPGSKGRRMETDVGPADLVFLDLSIFYFYFFCSGRSLSSTPGSRTVVLRFQYRTAGAPE